MTDITIAVAETYGVKITPGRSGSREPGRRSDQPALPNMKISAEGVTINGGPAGPVQLKVTPLGVTLKGPGNDLRHMGMTLFSKALRVEIC